MLHFDFTWDLTPDGIVFDPELNVDKLGWVGGDFFELVNVNGQVMLKKIDPLVKFIKGASNIQEN